jgi:hypothetical protein
VGPDRYIASDGGRDFIRPISQEVYGIPRDRVIGSANALNYTSDDDGGSGRFPKRSPTEDCSLRVRSYRTQIMLIG